MRMAFGTIVGFLLGGFLGYLVGTYVASEIFEAGTLGELVTLFITVPFGALSVSIAGGLLSQRRSPIRLGPNPRRQVHYRRELLSPEWSAQPPARK